MLRNLMTVLSLLSFAMLLTGCDLMGMAHRPPTVLAPTVVTKIKVERPAISLADMDCPMLPRPPEGGTQLDVAIFIVERDAWAQACKAKLADVREILRPGQEVTE